MKKIIFSLALFLSAMTSLASTNIDRIEPANWFVGMKNSSLQLMVYGKNIRNSRVSVDYPGVKIDSLVRLDSPDYLLVYLNMGGALQWEESEVSPASTRNEWRQAHGVHQFRRALHAYA